MYFNLGAVAEARKLPSVAIDWFRQIGKGEYFVSAQLKIAGVVSKRDGMAAGRRFLREAQLAETESPETRIQLILAESQLLRDARAHREAFDLLSGSHQVRARHFGSSCTTGRWSRRKLSCWM